jgi:SAM-dependent methyltransferase
MKPTPSASARSSDAEGAPHPDLRVRADCRLCGSPQLVPALDLGATPPANEFVPAAQRAAPQDRFPLVVFLCERCGHAQLRHVVNPERLFRNYVYVSSTSPVFVEHFRRYAQAMLELAAPAAGAQVVEIGSNDGVLLRHFQQAGLRVLGIDPARAIAAEATRQGIPTLPEFMTPALATRLRSEGWRPAIIAANNVFAHADDLHGIVEAVGTLLAPDGLFVFEVSYLLDVFEKTLFDTIYHEHLSYHTVRPLEGLFARHGMALVDVQRVDSHGGSLRVVVARTGSRWTRRDAVEQIIKGEVARGLFDPAAFARFAANIQARKTELLRVLTQLRAQGKRILGFGAPAKATTLMYHFGIGPESLAAIIDDSPWKQGLLSPGLHIPIVPPSALYDAATRPDAALILAWNFAEPIIAKHQRFRDEGGRFIVPLPEVRVV